MSRVAAANVGGDGGASQQRPRLGCDTEGEGLGHMAVGEEGGTSTHDVEVWVREELSLPAGAVLDIREKPGADPRCSDIVTEVAVDQPDEERYSFHIERPLAEVDRMDVVAAIAFGGGH